MPACFSVPTCAPAGTTEHHVYNRRVHDRATLVLRIGLLEYQGKASFCRLRNISPQGVQVKLYSSIAPGTHVGLRIGDEESLAGRVAWAKDGLGGIAFEECLDPETLLRVRQISAPQRRRCSPRACTSSSAILRSGGQEYSAKLCDISASGAKIWTARPIDAEHTAVLLLPKMPGLRAFVRWTHGQHAGLSFESPIPLQVITGWLTADDEYRVRTEDLQAVSALRTVRPTSHEQTAF